MINLTREQYQAVNSIATEINADPGEIIQLINAESSWNPIAKNPDSSARGLLQFLDATAQWLGYTNSAYLVKQNPSILEQLNGPVRNYLNKYKPYPSRQSLHMAVFYPAAQYWPEDKEFPNWVIDNNPGIKTPREYMDFVKNLEAPVYVDSVPLKKKDNITGPVLVAIAALAVFLLTREV